MKCTNCLRGGIYICSDNLNAWCNKCNSFFAHYEGSLFYLGKDPALRYSVRSDGSIRKVRRKEEGTKVIVEEERMLELENKLKELITKEVKRKELIWQTFEWWSSLPEDEKIAIYLSKSEQKTTSLPQENSK